MSPPEHRQRVDAAGLLPSAVPISSFSRLKHNTPVQPVEWATTSSNYITDVGRGRAGACTVTANQRRHDLPAALTHTYLRLVCAPGSARLSLRAVTHLVRGAAGAARLASWPNGQILPWRTGVAKHPAGLQRDPAKLRQAGEKRRGGFRSDSVSK